MSKVTISGYEAHYLLFALDMYVGTDMYGHVCPNWPINRSHGFSFEEIQYLRDKLFAAHEQLEEDHEHH